jgi:hypothetical protein
MGNKIEDKCRPESELEIMTRMEYNHGAYGASLRFLPHQSSGPPQAWRIGKLTARVCSYKALVR